MSEVVGNVGKWLLRSPPAEWAINQLREVLIGALKQGPVPQHVAFEMDGNRRYARGRRMETIEGHHHGFEALARVSAIPIHRPDPVTKSILCARCSKSATSPESESSRFTRLASRTLTAPNTK